jgi:hypothetical protein
MREEEGEEGEEEAQKQSRIVNFIPRNLVPFTYLPWISTSHKDLCATAFAMWAD